MWRGMLGELIRWPWFESMRRENPEVLVYAVCGIVTLLSILLPFKSAFGTMADIVFYLVLRAVIWSAAIYLYLAVGTKLAHTLIVVVCGIDAVIALWGAYTFYSILSLVEQAEQALGPFGALVPQTEVVSSTWIVFLITAYLVMSLISAVFAVLVYQGMKRLDRRR